jgi:hypothetical protein
LIADGSQEKFDLLREYEIKHGRVSMLAVTGYLTTAAGIRFPGAEGIPDGLKSFPALLETKDGQNVLLQMLAFFSVAEIVNRDASWLDNKAEFVGDYRNGALDFGWNNFDAATKLKKRTIELNQGRAAMMVRVLLLVNHMAMLTGIICSSNPTTRDHVFCSLFLVLYSTFFWSICYLQGIWGLVIHEMMGVSILPGGYLPGQ